MQNDKSQSVVVIRSMKDLLEFLNDSSEDLIVSITIVTEKEEENGSELRADLT